MKKIDRETLSQNNGKEGRPVYIAYKDRVIDVSKSPLWKGGVHMQRHHAGRELSADIQAAPHGLEVLDRYPQAAILDRGGDVERPEGTRPPAFLSSLITRFPLLRRHPHPMTVHFPLVFMISTAAFSFLYVITGYRPFDVTALHCLAAGLLTAPVAIGTGFYTWWLNYMARPMRRVTIKRRLSYVLFVLGAAALLWRLMVPDILAHTRGAGFFYLVLVCSLALNVLVIGWHGGQLTFPTERE